MTNERFDELARFFRLTPLMQQEFVLAYQVGYLVSRGSSRASQAYYHFCREEKRPLLVAVHVGSQDHVYANATIGGAAWSDRQIVNIVATFKSCDAIFSAVQVQREPVSVVSANFRRGMGELALWSLANHLGLGTGASSQRLLTQTARD